MKHLVEETWLNLWIQEALLVHVVVGHEILMVKVVLVHEIWRILILVDDIWIRDLAHGILRIHLVNGVWRILILANSIIKTITKYKSIWQILIIIRIHGKNTEWLDRKTELRFELIFEEDGMGGRRLLSRGGRLNFMKWCGCRKWEEESVIL